MIRTTATMDGANSLSVLAVFVCGAVASSAFTALARRYAQQRQLLDHPGQRRSHSVPTPRGGGIGPVLVLLGGSALLVAFDRQSHPALGICMLGLAAVAGIGWMDDHRPLPAWLRLAVHLGAALAASIALIGLPHTPLEAIVVLASTLVVAGLVNAWNFMDGIDGLAASQASMVAIILLFGSCLLGRWLDGAWWDIALLLLAATLGFLPFNIPRARIFLGDVGSGALGFVVACLLLRAVVAGGLPWLLALLPVSAFVVDAGMTLLLRVVHGKPWWRPHREHLYQWLVRSGLSHVHVTCCYALWTLAAGALTVALSQCSPADGSLIGSGALLCGCLLWMWLRNRLWMAARHRPKHHR
jgi:UDP-N-acetylmuramyl pentapeptide phosphotransferase/UDP-N-acetylglucosamine-1-phosphate transferase